MLQAVGSVSHFDPALYCFALAPGLELKLPMRVAPTSFLPAPLATLVVALATLRTVAHPTLQLVTVLGLAGLVKLAVGQDLAATRTLGATLKPLLSELCNLN